MNTVLTEQAIAALARIAAHSGHTRRAVLQDLIVEAEQVIVAQIPNNQANAYYDQNPQQP